MDLPLQPRRKRLFSAFSELDQVEAVINGCPGKELKMGKSLLEVL